MLNSSRKTWAAYPRKVPFATQEGCKHILKYFLFSYSSLVRDFPQETGYLLLGEKMTHSCINTETLFGFYFLSLKAFVASRIWVHCLLECISHLRALYINHAGGKHSSRRQVFQRLPLMTSGLGWVVRRVRSHRCLYFHHKNKKMKVMDPICSFPHYPAAGGYCWKYLNVQTCLAEEKH